MKPKPIFCEACLDTGWIQPTPFPEDAFPCPHCATAPEVIALAIRVPLPPRILSPNGGHGHWSQQAAGRLAYRQEVFTETHNAVIAAHWPAPHLARVSLVFCRRYSSKCEAFVHLAETPKVPCENCRYGPLDVPNAISAWKMGFDALKDAGAIREDHHMAMQLGSVTIDAKSGPWVDVTIEVVE